MRRQPRASQEKTNLPALWSWTSQPPELCERNVCCWNYPVYGILLYHPRTRTVGGSGGREGVFCSNWLRLRGGSGICFKIDENHRISVFFFFFFLIFWASYEACGISFPGPGTEPTCSSLESQSLNHWTTREVLNHSISERKTFWFTYYRSGTQGS